MTTCWYCYWGWPEEVIEIYEKYAGEQLAFGPGHIVWSDENFSDESIKWCLEYAKICPDREEISENHIEALKALLAVPEEIRCCIPEGYDDENPEKYPPSEKVKVRKR